MVLVPLRSMQISSPVFRHERWEATNRNRREAALTLPRLLQEKKKETRGWKYGVGFQPFGKYPQFDQKFIMWLLEQLGFPGGCCCTLYSFFNVVSTLKHTALPCTLCVFVCVLMQYESACAQVCVWIRGLNGIKGVVQSFGKFVYFCKDLIRKIQQLVSLA